MEIILLSVVGSAGILVFELLCYQPIARAGRRGWHGPTSGTRSLAGYRPEWRPRLPATAAG